MRLLNLTANGAIRKIASFIVQYDGSFYHQTTHRFLELIRRFIMPYAILRFPQKRQAATAKDELTEQIATAPQFPLQNRPAQIHYTSKQRVWIATANPNTTCQGKIP